VTSIDGGGEADIFVGTKPCSGLTSVDGGGEADIFLDVWRGIDWLLLMEHS
jgi:hypothetical protein